MIRETPGGLVTLAPRAIREPESVFPATEGFILLRLSRLPYGLTVLRRYAMTPDATILQHRTLPLQPMRVRVVVLVLYRYGDTRLSATNPPATRHSPANHNHVRA